MPPPRLNADRARRLLQDFRLTDLLIDELGWNNPSSRAAIPLLNAAGAAWTRAANPTATGTTPRPPRRQPPGRPRPLLLALPARPVL